jgi:hypothetical protein
MRSLIFCLFFLLIFVSAIDAQKSAPPLLEIKTDTADFHVRGYDIQVLEDNTGKLTFEQVSQQPLVDSFHLNNIRKYNFSAYAFWFRFRLKNAMDRDEDIYFTTGAEYTDYYIRRGDGSWKQLRMGDNIPRSKIQGIRDQMLASFRIKAGEELLIYRRDRNNTYVIPAELDTYVYFRDKVIQGFFVEKRDRFGGIIAWVFLAGILMLAAFFNIFFFVTTRDKVYLYFAMFVFFYSLNSLLFALFPIFFNEQPGLFKQIFLVCGMLGLFSIGNFIRHYFETYRYNRTLDRILMILIALMLLPFLQRLFLRDSTSHIWNILWYGIGSLNFQAICFVFFIVCLVYLKRKNAVRSKVIPALPVLFFWGVCFPCVVVFSLLKNYLHLPVPAIIDFMDKWEPVEELICLGWLVVFFSWNLFRSYQLLEKQIVHQNLEKEKERN